MKNISVHHGLLRRSQILEECYKSKVQKQAIYEGEVTESNQAFLQAELPLETHK